MNSFSVTYVGHIGHVLLHRAQHRHLEVLVVSVHEVRRRSGTQLHLVVAHFIVVCNEIASVRVLLSPVLMVHELILVGVVHHLELLLIEALEV